ncbi:MAG: LysR family transcriptional regulator [Clostridia bacterium]|nr:LysR family transcriptional regulator [Clostridia bacterium]
MNYEYYKIFYYVGKHKNITRAAVELYSSQPAVTRAIQNLETELGCRLFVRTKNGVEFTHEGQTLFDYVRIAHSQILKGEEEINQSINAESGTIYIGTTVTALHSFLFDVLDDFHLKHPNVKFKINTGSNNATIEKLKNGIVDVAFVSTPCNTSKTLNTVNVKDFNDILIAGNNFAQLKNKTLKLDDLKNHPFVSLRHSLQLRQFIDDFFAANEISVTPDIEADSADLLIPMISHNFGLGFVPQGMAEDAISRGEVFRIPLEKEMPKRYIRMITDFHHPQTNASREFSKAILMSLKIKLPPALI